MTGGRSSRGVSHPPIPQNRGVEDIKQAELDALAGSISVIVDEMTECSVERIFVCGSYARNEAIEEASDLDLRIVTLGVPDEEDAKRCEKELKHGRGTGICPRGVGFIDAHICPVIPDEDTAHTEINA